MKNSVGLLFIFCVLCAASLYPGVSATQTTEISQVLGPTSAIAGSENPISVSTTVSYDSVSGNQLIVGILDAELTPPVPVPGVVISSTDTCLNQGEPAAFCVVSLTKQAGQEQISFQIGGIFGGRRAPGKWDLNVTSELLDSKGNLVPGSTNSRLFQIELIPVALTITAPASVAVTIDGKLQPNGSASVGVALGQHNVTAPLLVQVNQGTRLRFYGWSDGYPSPLRTLLVTNTTSLQVIYRTQYLLTLTGIEPNATAATWYDSGTNATLSAVAQQPATGLLGSLGARITFQGWYENGQLISNTPTGAILMNGPHALTAVWQVDYSLPMAIAIAIVLVAAAIVIMVHRTAASSSRARRQRRRKRQ